MKSLLSTTILAAGALLASCASSASKPTTFTEGMVAADLPASTSTASATPSIAATESAPSATTRAVEVSGPSPALSLDDDLDDVDVGQPGLNAGDWEIVLAGSGGNDNNFDVGSFALAGSVGHFLSDSSEIGVRQSVLFSDFGNSNWNGSTRLFYDYPLLPGSEVRPLIGANIGGVYGDTVKDTFAAAPEVGFKFFLSPDAFLLLLAEYQFYFDSTNNVNNGFDNGAFVYTLGIGVVK